MSQGGNTGETNAPSQEATASSSSSSSSSSSCAHSPSLVVVKPTADGYRAQCLQCGSEGPKRGDMAQAWVALRRLRYRVGNDVTSQEPTPSYNPP